MRRERGAVRADPIRATRDDECVQVRATASGSLRRERGAARVDPIPAPRDDASYLGMACRYRRQPHIQAMRATLLASLLLVAAAGPASAQENDFIGDGGRLPQTLSPHGYLSPGPTVATGPILPSPTAPPPGPRSPASGMAARNRGLNSIPPPPAMQPDASPGINLGYTTPPQNPALGMNLGYGLPSQNGALSSYPGSAMSLESAGIDYAPGSPTP
jgi:hypothetical protein